MLIYLKTNESQFIFGNVVRGRVMAIEGICCANSELSHSLNCASPFSWISLKVHHHNPVPIKHGGIYPLWYRIVKGSDKLSLYFAFTLNLQIVYGRESLI